MVELILVVRVVARRRAGGRYGPYGYRALLVGAPVLAGVVAATVGMIVRTKYEKRLMFVELEEV